MRALPLLLALSAASLVVMTVIDVVLGPRAEFLNAWSVLQRLAGRAPSAGESLVARRVGPLGELGAVLLVNLAVGGLLAVLVRAFSRG